MPEIIKLSVKYNQTMCSFILDIVRPDVFVVNEDGATEEKRRLCEERNIRYVVLPREPKEKLPRRSTTDLRKPAEKQ